MRSKRSCTRVVLVSCILTCLFAVTNARAAKRGLTLDDILTNMHQASVSLHTLAGKIAQRRHNTEIGGMDDMYQGDIYMHHEAKCDKIRITYRDRDGVYQDVLVECEKIKLYQPRAHQVIDTTRSKEATKDPEYDFLATPYSSVASLRNRYNIVYSGDESIGGAAAARLEFTPIKPSSVRKLTLWVDQKAWIPIQYQFVEESTTTTFTLSALSINQKISPESFILKPAPGTKEQKR